MEAGGYKEGDLDIGVSFTELPHHVGKNILAGNRPCMVRNNDDTVIFSPGKFAQTRAVDRIFHCFTHNVKTCPVTGELIHFAGQNRCVIRHLQILGGMCIKEFYCLHRLSPFSFLNYANKYRKRYAPQYLTIQFFRLCAKIVQVTLILYHKTVNRTAVQTDVIVHMDAQTYGERTHMRKELFFIISCDSSVHFTLIYCAHTKQKHTQSSA